VGDYGYGSFGQHREIDVDVGAAGDVGSARTVIGVGDVGIVVVVVVVVDTAVVVDAAVAAVIAVVVVVADLAGCSHLGDVRQGLSESFVREAMRWWGMGGRSWTPCSC